MLNRLWRSYSLDLLCGSLAVLGLAPFHLWPVTIILLAILKYRLDTLGERPLRAGLWTGLAFALGYFGTGMYWIGNAFLVRGDIYILLMPFMVVALITLLSLFWALALFIYQYLRRHCNITDLASIGLFASLLSLAELARGHLFGGLPWNLGGYIFAAGKPVSQIAAIIGIYGLTAIVFLLAGLISASFKPVMRKPALIIASAILSGLYGYGYMRLKNAKSEFVDNVRLRIVHVAIDQSDAFDSEKAQNIIRQFTEASLSPTHQRITHIIWPEGAISGLAMQDPNLLQTVGQRFHQFTAPPPIWLLNSLRHERQFHTDGTFRDKFFNSSAAITFNSDGQPASLQYNDKYRLVPFGEYIPGADWVRKLNLPLLSTLVESLTPASQKRSAVFPGLPPLSPQICYEIIFPGLTPHRKNDLQPEWILNQSNDAWFGRSIGPYQHFNQARYRAIEEGLPIVRAASGGISGIINSYGLPVVVTNGNHTQTIDTKLPKPLFNRIKIYNIKLYLILICIGTCLIYICACVMCAAISHRGK